MMKISDLLRLCFDNLRRRKGRTALTAIGVMIGTCMIIVMVSFGVAINKSQEEMMASWGDLTQIQIMNYGAESAEIDVIDDKKVLEFSQIPHVLAATPIYQSNILNCNILAGKNGKYSAYGWNIYGMMPEAIEALGYNLQSGSYFSAGMDGKKIPVIVGQYYGYSFEDTTKSWRSSKRRVDRYMTDEAGNPPPPFFDVAKENLTLKTMQESETAKEVIYDLNITGVMLEDYSKGWYTSEGVIMDINLLKKLEAEYKKANGIKDSNQQQQTGYQEIYIKVDDVKNVEEVEQLIKDQGYNTYSMSSQREQMQKQAATMQMIFGGIGAISLMVAAIGIANTMIMSIYERTKEIGVMKVLGCRLGEIRKMFLIEAAAIGLLGGVVGIILSYTLSTVLNMFAPLIGSALGMYEATKISIIPPWLVLIGLGFSCLVGLVSGIIPANKAVKISALEAIRRE